MPELIGRGVLDHPLSRVMTSENVARIFQTQASRSRGAFRVRALHLSCPSENGGRREGRALAAPVARLQNKKQAAVNTGLAEHPAFPVRRF